MFVLYAIPLGLVAGRMIGGRLEGLQRVAIRWGPLALAALVVQILLFSPLAAGVPDVAARAIYVASTAAVLVAVAANLRLAGVPLVAAGAAANLAAIVANGGAMPADPGALATAGIALGGPSNSIVSADPLLRPLTDIFALPAVVPLANVFSVGDVLIGFGIAIAIAAAMRRGAERHP
ncbi:MAG TPA: DUF5317 family protein [Candidatus Limnocylindrales bacterium]|nr:DUF5317 family protein [Candidatus Limnocylindrales bacterium]